MKSTSEAFNYFDTYMAKHQKIDKSKYKSVKNFVNNNINLKVYKDLPSGSYDRTTRVPHESDIDVIIVFTTSKPKSAKKHFLKIWKKVKKAATNANKAVRAIKFKFKSTEVDLVPAYENKNGQLYVSNSNQNIWQPTDPKKNKKVLGQLNYNNKSRVIPMIRFFKLWNYKEKCRFGSFHLEAIIMDIFNNDKNLKSKKWPEIFQEITKKLGGYVTKTIPEPAGVGPDLQVSKKHRECLKKRISALQQLTNQAINYEFKQNKVQKAISTWKKILGNQFGKKH